ncbi:MAG: glycosyltransferase family 4 protein [Veillonellales bacterium]
MRLLISYDGYIFKLNGKYYFSELDEILLMRYLRVFDNIILVLRTKEVNFLDPFYSIPLNDARIEVYEVPMFQGPIEYAKVYFKVRKVIKRASKKADMGIFRLPSTVGTIACNFIKNSGKPYLVEVVANPYETVVKVKCFIISVLMKIIHKSLVANCKKAKGVAYVTKKQLPDIYPANDYAITEFYSSVELNKDYFFNERNFPQERPFKIIHIANNITQSDSKGIVTALHVIGELVKNGLDVSIVFVGERKIANLFDNIAKEIGITDRVNFVGRKTKKELRELLIKSDLLLFPSRSEGLPRVIIEANALSLPCVASDVGGIRELLEDDVLFDVDDYKGMANKITEIFSNKELYEHLCKVNFENAKLFESSILNKKRDKFYSALLTKS